MTGAAIPPREPAWVDEVVRFWLLETPAEARFKASADLDAAIRRSFRSLYDLVKSAPPELPSLTPRLALASVIVLDQFPRNMFRGTATAFDSDEAARRIASAAVDAGLDRSLDKDGRLFLYLPFEHAEDLAQQERAVALVATLGDAELDKFAIAHRDIIRRFGRFPHRNAALGRASTTDEVAFLEEPGSSF